jgi:hypothetical protein
MTVSQKVMEILNNDQSAKRMNKAFNEAAERQGLTGRELEGAREAMLMMLISNNTEAMRVMAQEVYNHHNQL